MMHSILPYIEIIENLVTDVDMNHFVATEI